MGGGKKHTSTSTQTLDPATQAAVNQKYAAATAWGNSAPIGVDQATMDALNQDKSYAAYGNQGLLAMQGDPAAMDSFRTPGGEDILKEMDVNNAAATSNAINATNQSATRSGAFGGKRAAVAQGTAVAGVNANTANQKAQFQYQRNQDAQARAQAAMGIGQNATQAQTAMGQYLQQLKAQNDPAYRKLMASTLGLQGTPYGTTTTATTTTPWLSIIGGGIAGGLGAMKGGG
jgi:hypothetical protein